MNLVVSRPSATKLGAAGSNANGARFQIDDAVEVKQITKTNDTETRRHLGVRSEASPKYQLVVEES